MTKQIEYREDCFETIRECIKGKMSLKATIDECEKTYPDVHPQTFRKWYKKIKKEDWNSCVNNDQPFVQYEFLFALEQSESACTQTGWKPYHQSLIHI